MGHTLKSILFLAGMLLALQAEAGQKANQAPVATPSTPVGPTVRFFGDGAAHSWSQVFYGATPRPRKMSRLEKRARQTSDALARVLAFAKFEDERFEDILDDFFTGQYGLEVVVDWAALATCSASVTRASKVHLEVDRASVEEVLEEVLERLSEPAQVEEDILTFFVLDGKVKVSTRSAFDKLIVTRIYNISFLGRGTPHFVDAPELGFHRRTPPDLAERSPNLNLSPQAGTSRNPRRNFEELRDELIHMLKDFRPESWKEHAGRGTISIMGNELMIRQTCEMHELIGGKWW